MRDLGNQTDATGRVEFEVTINEPSFSWTITIAFGPVSRRTIGSPNTDCQSCTAHNDIEVRRDFSVTRFHALLSLASGELRVSDVVASTGTFVNGYRLKPGESSVLGPNDQVRVGQTVIRIAKLNPTRG
jgi:hypothetical protein